jgi:hypothetical protein
MFATRYEFSNNARGRGGIRPLLGAFLSSAAIRAGLAVRARRA